jgi:hypothetical protein
MGGPFRLACTEDLRDWTGGVASVGLHQGAPNQFVKHCTDADGLAPSKKTLSFRVQGYHATKGIDEAYANGESPQEGTGRNLLGSQLPLR